MADTKRTEAELLKLIGTRKPWGTNQNNTNSAIVPQDIRDIIVSLFAEASYGSLGVEAQTTGQTTGIDTYEFVDEYDTTGPASPDITQTLATGRFTVANSGVYLLTFCTSTSVGAGGGILTYSFAVDGTEVGPEFTRTFSGTEVGSVAAMHTLELTAGSYVAVHVKSAAAETVVTEGRSFAIARVGDIVT